MITSYQIFLSFATLFLLLLPHPIHAQTKTPTPLILGCGSSNPAKDADGRTWEPDTKYIIVAGNKSVVSKAEIQDPSLPSSMPYMTARIFETETTYKFPLQNSSSRTLLRLHFYPSSYPNYNISKSYFSVTAGSVTLLNNFSASLSAEALSQAYFIKEYYLAPSEFPTLNLTFKPSDQQPQSFAFINGIEVISTPPVFDSDPVLAGTSGSGSNLEAATTYPIDKTSMEAMYRLNVGGQYIDPTKDTDGLMRSWYDDSVFIYGAGQGVALTANTTVSYKGLPSYIAPLDVYKSYRSMGAFADVNKVTNLTWIFQVDPNFMYLLRFHWCDSEMTKTNQRVFDVFINNKTAASEMDLFALTGAIATPTKRDYVVRMSNMSYEDAKLWVELHPTDATKAQFADVLLNGLEIFKLSDTAKSNLAGPNPTISDMMLQYQQAQMGPASFDSYKKSYTKEIITGAAGGAAAIGVAFVIFIVAYKRTKRDLNADGTTTWLPISWNSSTGTMKSSMSGKSQGTAISSDAACNCRYFSLTEIKNATKNFDESNVIGVGGFGKVYKGVIDGGELKVAIKRSNPSSEQGINEFQTEIEMLSRLRHRHLVSLIGFCEDNGEMILVYDYMGQGTLREHLYKNNKIVLTWKQRLDICIGAARGLHYLHTGAKYTIIHRDVKTTNILLDDKWVAKVSDFGLSKTGPDMNKGHVSTVVKGSFGYLDPEYFKRQQLTEKSDVYSFGVVLFEVLCARPALNPSLPKEQVSLADWALRCARNNTLDDMIDPHLKGKVSPESLKKFMETAEKCLADHGVDRPSMGDVLWNLEFALQLHENPDQAKRSGSSVKTGSVDFENFEAKVDQNSIMAMHRSILNLDDDDDDNDNQAQKDDNPDEIFSQIVNPKGR